MSAQHNVADATYHTLNESQSTGYPLVSIILPVFNDQDTLTECLDSLRKQSYSNFEIIVVNDSSSDRSPEIAHEMAMQDSRLKLLDIPHSGTSTAKNSGFQSSKGSIIFFAEGDAIYNDSYLSKAVECIRNDSSIGGVCVLGGVWETRRTFVTRSIDAENQIRDTQLITGKRSPYFAWVFTRNALEKAGLYDPRLKQAEDRELFGRVRKSGFKIGLVGDVLWRHRRNETTWQFVKKSYKKGTNRVAYLAKERKAAGFLKGVAGLWGLVALVLLSIVNIVFLYALIAILILGLGYLYFAVFRLKLVREVSKVRLALLPVYRIIRYLSNALGYSVGLIVFLFSRSQHGK